MGHVTLRRGVGARGKLHQMHWLWCSGEQPAPWGSCVNFTRVWTQSISVCSSIVKSLFLKQIWKIWSPCHLFNNNACHIWCNIHHEREVSDPYNPCSDSILCDLQYCCVILSMLQFWHLPNFCISQYAAFQLVEVFVVVFIMIGIHV